MRQLLIRWVIVALAVLAATYIVPGVDVHGSRGLITVFAMALILGIVNTFIRPIVVLLSLPAIILSLGLFLIAINAAMFGLASWLVPNFSVDGILSALAGSLIVSIVAWLLAYIVPEAKSE